MRDIRLSPDTLKKNEWEKRNWYHRRHHKTKSQGRKSRRNEEKEEEEDSYVTSGRIEQRIGRKIKERRTI
jgi:hypothetical protein